MDSKSSGNSSVPLNRVTYKVQNVVTSVNLNTDIDLDKIRNKFLDVNFNMNRFPGLCIKLKQPKCVILLFKNGKMVITGLKLSSQIPDVLTKFRKRLVEVDIKIPKEPEYRVVNMVVSADIGLNINLDLSSLTLDRSIYEPEVFPGLIYRMVQPKCVFLVFSTGKFVITGLKREEDIEKVIITFGKILRSNMLFTELAL
ncbi:MAG: TATA-box-binding protein [Promethearchaeota archaeon]